MIRQKVRFIEIIFIFTTEQIPKLNIKLSKPDLK